jgi:SAM-dependent methyltransferase
VSVIWHDLECGSYAEDVDLWRELAAGHPGPILDVGAGTGRVALELARLGHHVTALDIDAELLQALEHRADGLPVRTIVGDARRLELPERFGVCLVPMQTIQLLGGAPGRKAFLSAAHRQLVPGGILAVALSVELEPFEVPEGTLGPLPDVCELDGVVYSSLPTAVRAEADGFVLERRREVVSPSGERSVEEDRIRLDHVPVATLEREAIEAGFAPTDRREITPTPEYTGSTVVMLRA